MGLATVVPAALPVPVPAVCAESPSRVTLPIQAERNPIGAELFGVLFEEIGYAADGGLYVELVQNRSFEYQATERLHWTPLAAWEAVTRDGRRVWLAMADAIPVNSSKPHYVVVETVQPSSGAGLTSAGQPRAFTTFGNLGVRVRRTWKRVTERACPCDALPTR